MLDKRRMLTVVVRHFRVDREIDPHPNCSTGSVAD